MAHTMVESPWRGLESSIRSQDNDVLADLWNVLWFSIQLR